MVTLSARFQARLTVGTAELVQPARRNVDGEVASALVCSVPAVQEPIALLFRWEADATRTLEVFALAVSVA